MMFIMIHSLSSVQCLLRLLSCWADLMKQHRDIPVLKISFEVQRGFQYFAGCLAVALISMVTLLGKLSRSIHQPKVGQDDHQLYPTPPVSLIQRGLKN